MADHSNETGAGHPSAAPVGEPGEPGSKSTPSEYLHAAAAAHHMAGEAHHVAAANLDNAADAMAETPADETSELTGGEDSESGGSTRAMPAVSFQSRAFAYPRASGAARSLRAATRGRRG